VKSVLTIPSSTNYGRKQIGLSRGNGMQADESSGGTLNRPAMSSYSSSALPKRDSMNGSNRTLKTVVRVPPNSNRNDPLDKQNLILVNGRNSTDGGGDSIGRMSSSKTQLLQKRNFSDSIKVDQNRLRGNSKYEAEPAELPRRPFNGRSSYGKLHKLPTVKSNTNSTMKKSVVNARTTSAWDNDPWVQFPKPATAISAPADRNRGAMRASSGTQLNQSAYFPSTTLYSKNVYNRKVASEPSVSYYHHHRQQSSSQVPAESPMYTSNRPTPIDYQRKNWAEPLVERYPPHVQATMHASDLFDLQNNIQRSNVMGGGYRF